MLRKVQSKPLAKMMQVYVVVVRRAGRLLGRRNFRLLAEERPLCGWQEMLAHVSFAAAACAVGASLSARAIVLCKRIMIAV
jgi:hypothetical protein